MIANSLLVYVTIRAIDQASAVLRMLGISGGGAFAALGIGAGAVVGAVAAVAAVSLKAASSFDLYMTKVKALTVVTNKGNDNMNYYRQSILALSSQLGVSADSLAQGLYFIKSAGLSGAGAIDALRYSAMTAKAGMVDLQGVADAVTSALNAYRGAGYSAGQVTDMLHLAVVNGKMEWSDLVTSFGFTATTARTAGLSLQEVASAVSALTAVAGHHGARRIQMELDNLMRSMGDTKRIEKTAHSLGIMFDPAKFAASNFIDKLKMLMQASGFSMQSLQDLRAKANGNEATFEQLALRAADANSNFRKLVGGAAAFIPAAILLSDKGESFNAILAQMHTHGEVTRQSFEEMGATLTQRMQSFEAQLQTIAITIGEQLMPVALRFAGWLGDVAGRVGAFLNNTAGMNAFKYALAGIALVATTILVPALLSVVVTSAPVWGPIALAILGIVAAGLILGKILQAVSARFGGMSGVMRALHPLISLVQTSFARAGREIQQALANPAVHQALAQLQATLPRLIPFLQVIGFIVGAILVVGFQLFVAILRGVVTALPGLLLMFTGFANVLGGIGRLITDIFTGKWSDIKPALKQIGLGILQWLAGIGLAVAGLIYGVFEHFVQLFGSSDAKIKAGLAHAWTTIRTTVGGWFSALGTQAHDGVTAVGQRFSDLGTAAHNTLLAAGRRILDAILWPWRQTAALGRWLYQHNYYVQHFVDGMRSAFLRARAWVYTTFLRIKLDVLAALVWLESEARAKWQAFSNTVIAPIERMALWLLVRFNLIRAWVTGELLKLVGEARLKWFAFVALIDSLKTRIMTAIQKSLIDPITQPVQKLTRDAHGWGRQLMEMLAHGIESGAVNIENAAKKALGKIAGWLGFHSPAPHVPESAHWGANLVTMVARSMLTRQPALTAAAQQLAATLGAAFGAPGGLGGALGGLGSSLGALNGAGALGGLAGAGAAVGSGAGLGGGGALAETARRGTLLAGAGRGATTINVTFPGVRNKDEIKAALTELQQGDYRKARRAGGFGGLRAGIDTLSG